MEALKKVTLSQSYFKEVLTEIPAIPEPGIKMAAAAAAEGEKTDKYTGDSGLFTFVLSNVELSKDPKVIKQVNQAKYYLKGFMSLVTGKLFKDNKDNVQKVFKIPPENIKEVATHLPLIDSFSSEELSNHKNTTAVELSTDFLTMALGAAVGSSPAAIASATKWLNSLGEKIKASAKKDVTDYNISIFSGIIEVLGTGGIIDIEAQFCISGVTLSVSDIEASLTGCASAKSFTLNYKGSKFVGGLNLDALSNPEVKEKVDAMVTDKLVKQIDDSGSYFGAG